VILFLIAYCFFFLTFLFILYVIFYRKLNYWIFSDIKRGICNFFKGSPKSSIHVIFCFADHFEPGNRNAKPKQQKDRVDAWVERYPLLASKHKDSDGICPQHTFFFPPHYDTDDHLRRIVDLCSEGFGEVEMHLHHDRQDPWPDDEATLHKKVLDCIEAYSRHGVFCLPNGQRVYAFIHGDWALANSLKGGKHCGINSELAILKDTGCYADFTFPVCNEAQPKLANTLFYAQTRVSHPKSYNIHSRPIEVGKEVPRDSLMLIQGVIGLRWKSRIHKIKPSIEQSNVDISDYPFPKRIDFLVRKRIHVKGRPEWIFIKMHTHGAREEDQEVLLGKTCDDMFSYFEARYNDGSKYFLHYVSAREMFNIITAAKDGRNGNPGEYRDYLIPRYCYLPKRASPSRNV
jgi:hypothetical protein